MWASILVTVIHTVLPFPSQPRRHFIPLVASLFPFYVLARFLLPRIHDRREYRPIRSFVRPSFSRSFHDTPYLRPSLHLLLFVHSFSLPFFFSFLSFCCSAPMSRSLSFCRLAPSRRSRDVTDRTRHNAKKKILLRCVYITVY